MVGYDELLNERRAHAEGRLNEVRKAFRAQLDTSRADDICIYVTGSYGRLEAAPTSDLDLFFVCPGSEVNDDLSIVESSLLNASVIKICRDLHFPEFSRGGMYLSVHFLSDILDRLGGQRDDYLNHFTARMLLLLESSFLYNSDVYKKSIKRIVKAYWIDYHEHEKDFQPIFLVNDILRFWRTMCLNYEHNRERENATPYEKKKAHIKNLKLKFSRMLTCYSAIMEIIAIDGPVNPRDMLEIVKRTPIQRLMNVVDGRSELLEFAEKLLEDYSWFLSVTGRSEEEVIKWIAEKGTRDRAFARARRFGKNVFDIIQKIPSNPEKLRYLVV